MHENGAKMRTQILLPATFQERGASVPFSTPVIAFARIRRNEEGLPEALVPGLSGGRGTYVLPWGGIRSMVSMSVFDRQLEKALVDQGALSPASIRQIALDLSKSGVSGADAAKAAKEALDKDNSVRVRIRQVLLQAIVDRFGDQTEPIDIASMGEQDAMLAAGRVLGTFARKQDISGDQLIDVLIEWSRLIEPIGFPEQDCEGYMRRRAQGLRDLSRDISKWADSEPPKSQRFAHELALAAQSVVEQAEFCLAAIDGCRTNLRDTVLKWPPAQAVLEREIRRIDWLVDGWDILIRRWREAEDLDRHEQRLIVAEMHQFMPILPEAEITGGAHDFWRGVMEKQDAFLVEGEPAVPASGTG